MDPALDRAAPSPGNGFKRGFVLAVYSQKFFGGVAELSSASIHMGNAIRELYSDFEAQRGSHPGQVPVIACTGSEPMKDRHGTNYRPKLEIVKWVDRPAELPDQSPVDPSEMWQGPAGCDRQDAGRARAASPARRAGHRRSPDGGRILSRGADRNSVPGAWTFTLCTTTCARSSSRMPDRCSATWSICSAASSMAATRG